MVRRRSCRLLAECRPIPAVETVSCQHRLNPAQSRRARARCDPLLRPAYLPGSHHRCLPAEAGIAVPNGVWRVMSPPCPERPPAPSAPGSAHLVPSWRIPLAGLQAEPERLRYEVIHLQPADQGQHVAALLIGDGPSGPGERASGLFQRQAIFSYLDKVIRQPRLLGAPGGLRGGSAGHTAARADLRSTPHPRVSLRVSRGDPG
jgi:hypothetical protein